MTAWEAAIWDAPRNGRRYYVRKPDPAAYAGEELHCDERGDVITYPSRQSARRAAAKLNEADARRLALNELEQ